MVPDYQDQKITNKGQVRNQNRVPNIANKQNFNMKG